MALEDVLAQIAQKKAQITALEDEVKDLYSLVPEAGEVGKHVAGRYILEVSPNRRFDAGAALKALSKAKFDKICKKVPDTTLAKAVLTGDEYEACQKVVGLRRQVKVVVDE